MRAEPTEMAIFGGPRKRRYPAAYAWALDYDDPDEFPTQRLTPRRITSLALASSLTVIAAAGAILLGLAPAHESAVTALAAVFDGTYRYDYNFEQQTVMGLPNPPPEGQPKSQTHWGASRSTCTPNGCTAATTALDDKNHDIADTPPTTRQWRFVNGRWETAPDRDREKVDWCTGDEDKKVAGEQTVSYTKWLQPQLDGTLRGVLSSTVVSNECGLAGSVSRYPFTVIRVGDVPSGVAVGDPSKITWPPVVPPITGPVLNGTYRIDNDDLHATVSGGAYPNAGTNNTTASKSVRWGAFESACTPTGCAAVAIDLDETNHQEPDGMGAAIGVFHFADGHWVTDRNGKLTCASLNRTSKNATPTDIQTVRRSLDLEPQPDGTLRGVQRVTVETDECGVQGAVITTSVVATRTGPVSPNVVLPDPALFA